MTVFSQKSLSCETHTHKKILITTMTDEICLWKKNNKATLKAAKDFYHKPSPALPHGAVFSSLNLFNKKPGSQEPRGQHINESSWFINSIKWLWKHCRVMKCLKSTTLFQSLLTHLQPRYCPRVLKHNIFSAFKTHKIQKTQSVHSTLLLHVPSSLIHIINNCTSGKMSNI